jgi:hypothetical protein
MGQSAFTEQDWFFPEIHLGDADGFHISQFQPPAVSHSALDAQLVPPKTHEFVVAVISHEWNIGQSMSIEHVPLPPRTHIIHAVSHFQPAATSHSSLEKQEVPPKTQSLVSASHLWNIGQSVSIEHVSSPPKTQEPTSHLWNIGQSVSIEHASAPPKTHDWVATSHLWNIGQSMSIAQAPGGTGTHSIPAVSHFQPAAPSHSASDVQ